MLKGGRKAFQGVVKTEGFTVGTIVFFINILMKGSRKCFFNLALYPLSFSVFRQDPRENHSHGSSWVQPSQALYESKFQQRSSGIVSKIYPIWLCCIVVVFFFLIQTSFANFDLQKQLKKTW